MTFKFWRSPGTGTKDTDPLLETGLFSDTIGNDPKPYEDESDDESDDDQEVREARAERLRETGGWYGYLKDFTIFLPYVIPKNDAIVQFSILISIVTIILERAFRVAVPYLLGIIADKVTSGAAPMRELAIYFAVDVLSGQSGVLLIQELAKIPITQFSYKEITNASFKHVMAQSIDFHSTQDSAEVMKTIEQGFALGNVLESVVFEIAPTFVDVIVACVMFYRKFNAAVAIILLAASIVYLTAEAFSARLTTNDRRRVTKAERAQIRSMHQAVQGWQTVTFFNQFQKEARTLSSAVEDHLTAKRRFDAKQDIFKALVEFLVPVTFFGLAYLILQEIASGKASPGDFVFFLQYWDSIIYPIKYLSDSFRWLATDFVDAERLLMLLKTKPTVTDAPDAMPLATTHGNVEFKNVSFMYDQDRQALSDVSFTVSPGQTIALVGQTGAGKSSVLRLLLRLYDVSSGSISISNRDIRSIPLGSLRDVLGIVPQTPVFFNASIMENVRYARSNATDEDVFAACRAAAMHDTIMQYRDGYDTQVGERGVKLSGGEAQRLAIARALLKNAPIVLLDEATSAVDTVTEGKIKEGFRRLKDGRIAIVIAHRLSTIVEADQIFVFHEGRIVERGNYEELCKRKGRYFDLWQQA
ncbi:P-loop containing nucleoside triphosphate hydrolase protein [Pyrenochaeta sp. MPI-SDFR-AT-0127]|nr:P-loop containing nucleoside triphosphate hydrolase protein [Pyrenochaeta sp. MPI-SDFR-AT-0127]